MNFNRRILYACGQIGMMGLARFFFTWILGFADTTPATIEHGAMGGSSVLPTALFLFSGAAVGALLLGFRIFDGITDPVAGVVSDLWVRKGHQRRSLLWFSFFVPSLGLALCFTPTHAMDPATRWIFLAAGMFIFFVGYTFYIIPYWSLIEDYGGDNTNERRILSNILGVGLLLATAIGGLISPILVESLGYRAAAMTFAIPGSLLMVLPYFAAPKRIKSSQREIKKRQASLSATMIDAFRHRRFVAVLVMFAGSQMSFTIVTSAAVFIAMRLLGGTEGDLVRIMGPLLATAIPTFLIVPMFSRAIGWERAMLVASLALCLAYVASAGLGEAWIGSKWMTATIVFAFAGPMVAILLGLEGEAITACARARGAADCVSIYFGVFNFIVKGLNGLAIWIAGLLLDLSRNPEYAIGAIRAMNFTAGALLAVCVLIYFIIRPRGTKTEAAG